MSPARTPGSTYRFQIRGEFGFRAAAAQAGYLADLGVSHAYLSPVLEPTPGSGHGYDVVDHTALNSAAGGRAGFDELIGALHAAGVRAIADVVPNHMAVPTPVHLNAPLWSVLREGRQSPYANWFDIDWAAGDETVLMPILGAPLSEVLAAGELKVAQDGGPAGDESVVRYFDHELPVRDGTESLPIDELVARQWWRLAFWRAGETELNYRRFFDVTSLIAIRVEDEAVFDRTHALLVGLVADGSLDGLRIDHPDGLADPRGYLRLLAAATDDAWVVVEKILEGDESLPRDWPCAGSTGYDALQRIGGVFVDPAGEQPLTELLAEVTGGRDRLTDVVAQAKTEVVARVQTPEVNRLVRLLEGLLPGEPPQRLRRVVAALLVSMDRYRAYVVPGEPAPPEQAAVLHAAAERAGRAIGDDDRPTLGRVVDLALGIGADPSEPAGPMGGAALADFVVRFQQTCGPVMAKGIEDTAFYRWHRLVSLNEVGGDPDHFGVTPDELTAHLVRTAADWPDTMTTLSTHDTKRSEDVRARISAISERPGQWRAWLSEARELAAPHRDDLLDPATEYLLWQTLVGTWPITVDRLQAYALKATREAKQHTTWTEPDLPYETAVSAFVDGVLSDPSLGAHLERWVASAAPLARATTLGQKLLQLTAPGVPDVYQGSELVDLSLVDPDNRREVDYDDRRARLSRLDAGGQPRDLSDEKLLVTSRALRLRRQHPGWFHGPGTVVTRVPCTSAHALALGRGEAGTVRAVAVVTRLAGSMEGWAGHTLELPAGSWTELLTGRTVEGGLVPLADLLDQLPVALLVSADD